MSDTEDDDLPEVDEDDSAERAACAEALRKFFAASFKPGSLLTHLWLQDALGMPDPMGLNSLESYKRWQFSMMARLNAFQKALLLTHKIALASVYGKGYRIVLSNDQSGWALHEAVREFRKSLSKGISRATHVNLHALSTEERQAQLNDLTRLKSLREALRRDETAAKMRARANEFDIK